MALQFSPLLVPLVLAALVSTALAAVVYPQRDNGPAQQLLAILTATAIWAAADAARLGVTQPSMKLLWHNARFLGSTLIVLAVLMHALAYTGRTEWVTSRTGTALAAVFAVTNMLAWTDYALHGGPLNALIYTGYETTTVWSATVLDIQYGTWFFINAAYAAVLLSVALGLYVSESRRRAGMARRRTLSLALALALPMVTYGLYLTGVSPVDLTAAGFTLTGAVFFARFRRGRSRDVLRAARTTLIDRLESGYLLLDTDGRILDSNDAASRHFRVPPGAVTGRTLRELSASSPIDFRPDDLDDVGTISVLRDGERRYYEVDSAPVADGAGNRLGRVLLVHDVTDKHSNRRSLAERTRDLHQQTERLDRIARVVSHDLRPILAEVGADLEKAGRNDEPVTDDRIREAIDRMDAITEDVLEHAGQPSSALDAEAVELPRLCTRAWEAVDTGEATMDVETDRVIRADPDRLRGVLETLFGNAVGHGPTGVAVRVGDCEDGFFVADDGPGIPPHLHDTVFEAGFSSTDGAPGLGLARVRRTAADHGWDVTLGNSSTGGARFTFTGVAHADETVTESPGDERAPERIGGFVFGDHESVSST